MSREKDNTVLQIKRTNHEGKSLTVYFKKNQKIKAVSKLQSFSPTVNKSTDRQGSCPNYIRYISLAK